MKALQSDKQGLCSPIDLPTLDGIKKTSHMTEIKGWGRLDGMAEVWEAESGAYEIFIPLRSLGAAEMGKAKSERKADAARENAKKGGRPRTKTVSIESPLGGDLMAEKNDE